MAGTNQSVPKYKRHEKKVKDERDYVDKDKFYAALVEYNQQIKEAEANYLPEPIPSDYIGQCIMMIVDRVIKSHRFKGYTDLWKDEMRSEALVSAVKSIKKFDVERFDNPFAYFTTIVYYNFYNTINKERKAHKVAMEHTREENLNYTEIGADGFTYHVSDVILERMEDEYEWGVSSEAYEDFDWSKKSKENDYIVDSGYDEDEEDYSDSEKLSESEDLDDYDASYDEDFVSYKDKSKLEQDYQEISYKIGTDYPYDDLNTDSFDDIEDDENSEMRIDKLF